MSRSYASDEGFSLIEVMFAAFIAFFVLTAVFGMMVVSTRQGTMSSADEVATQLAQLAMEQARALPYESVGIYSPPSGQVPGVLPSSETTVFQALTFTIGRRVTWVDDPANNGSSSGDVTHDYKQVEVTVSWTGGHTTPLVSYVREHTNESPTPPLVVWVKAPPANKVVFLGNDGAAHVWAGDPAQPDAYTAEAVSMNASASVVTTTGSITRFEYYVDSKLMGGPFAPWTGDAPTVTHPSAATAINLSATDSSGTALFPDGLRVIRAVAYTNTMASGSQVGMFTVDNAAPVFLSGSSVSLVRPSLNSRVESACLDMSYSPAMDGADVARRYDIGVQASGSATTTYLWQDIGMQGGPVGLGKGIPVGWAPANFTPYKFRLVPRSVRGLTGSNSVTSDWAVTAPRLSGSVFNRAANKKAAADLRFDLSLTAAPAGLAALFGGTSIVYDVYTCDGPSAYTYPGSGNLPGSAIVALADQAGPPFQVLTGTSYSKYLQVEAKIKNAAGTVVARIRSNVVGAPTAAPTFQTSATLAVP